LAAGSVIIAMHHEQDLRKMGNLKKYLPVTYVTFLIGALTLAAVPPTAGFFSKDIIIDAVHRSTIFGSEYCYIVLLMGTFVTAYYIFRAFLMAFHTEERMDHHTRAHLQEHWIMLFPLILLAIPSLLLGIFLTKSMLFATPGWLGGSFLVLPQYDVLSTIHPTFISVWHMMTHAIETLPFWFSIAGIICACVTIIVWPGINAFFDRRFSWIRNVLVYQYGFDLLNHWFFERGTRKISYFFYHITDLKILDSGMVDGSGRNITRLSIWLRKLQSGYLYHYVGAMIIGLLGFLIWLIFW